MSIPPDNYIGEPDYPTTWTTKKPREALRDNDEGRIVCLAPDVCLTPIGSSMVPIPYPIVDFCGHDNGYAQSVRLRRRKIMLMRSRTTHVHGDKPGTGKGIKSRTVEDVCEPVGHADNVRAEGSHVIRHLDRFKMNRGNTEGEAILVRNTKTYEPPKEDDPVPGSLRATDERHTMNDAAPERLIPGEEYAAASNAAAQNTPQFQPEIRPSPGNAPTSSPPGNVITRDVPHWRGPPPAAQPVAEPMPGTANGTNQAIKDISLLTKILRIGTPTGFAAFVLSPTSTATAWQTDYPPEDEFEQDLFQRAKQKQTQDIPDDEISKWFMDQLARHRLAKQREQEKDNQKQAPLPQSETARSSDEEEEKRECLVGEYKKIYDACTAMGGRTHHVVPDMVYRLGGRRGKQTRIPDSPTLNEGMSICLTKQEHSSKGGSLGVHDNLNKMFKGLDEPGYPGTARMWKVLAASKRALLRTKGIDPDCAMIANEKTQEQVENKTGLEAPGRITSFPYPDGDSKTVLENGYYPVRKE